MSVYNKYSKEVQEKNAKIRTENRSILRALDKKYNKEKKYLDARGITKKAFLGGQVS